MTTETYIRQFNQYDAAFDFMRMKNKTFENAGNKSTIFCVVPGPDDNYAVVDLRTAIELEIGYVWAFSGYISNPFLA